jgi:hypothetical protein
MNQGWTGTLVIDGNGAVASNVQYPVSMTHGGTTSVMPATVFSTLTWNSLVMNDPVITAGNDLALPLTNAFILGTTQGSSTDIEANASDTFPLATQIQVYVTVAFGYSVDAQQGTVSPLDLTGVPAGQLAQWLANNGDASTGASNTIVLAVYDLSLTSPNDDFAPKHGMKTGATCVVRTYPLLSVWCSRQAASLCGELDIIRPGVTQMDGMALNGAISSSVYTDMNSPGKSLYEELAPKLKNALDAAALGASLAVAGSSPWRLGRFLQQA